MDKRSIKIYTGLILTVVLIILIINYFQGNGDHQEDLIDCISQNSLLIIKTGCSACSTQKQILSESIEKFEIIDCLEDSQKCAQLNITKIPTWIIKEQSYTGVHSIEELKNLTEC
jgi:glutaredoxin